MPALGFVSDDRRRPSRGRPSFGYPALVLALVATGFLAFGLWVHHMFATGLPQLGESFFTAASMMIAHPHRTADLLLDRHALRRAAAYVSRRRCSSCSASSSSSSSAGSPGSCSPRCRSTPQVHDTYFVVAHLHYVLIGGAVFPLFGGFYYWFPKFTGRMLIGAPGPAGTSGCSSSASTSTFFPMHMLGLEGMPRRIYTYRATWVGGR